MITDALLLTLKVDAVHAVVTTITDVYCEDDYLLEQANKLLEVLSGLQAGVKLTANKIKHIEDLLSSTLVGLTQYKQRVLHDTTVMLTELTRLLKAHSFGDNENIYMLVDKSMKEYKEASYSIFKQFEIIYELLFKLNMVIIESEIPDTFIESGTTNVVSLMDLLNKKAHNDGV